MSHVPHDLHQEFPADAAILHALKLSDAHFQRLSEQHHQLNREIHRIESEVTPASDVHLEHLKKERLGLLDQIAVVLAKAKAAA